MFIHIPSVVKPVLIFMAKNRVAQSCLVAELCFHRFVHKGSCVVVWDRECVVVWHREDYIAEAVK